MSKLIEGWESLVGLENDQYYLDIDLEGGSGWIRKKVEDNEWPTYLSTHTFYGSQYKYSTMVLQEHGFDVQIKNWDGPTEKVDAREQWKYSGKCNICKRKIICLVMCSAASLRLKNEGLFKEED